MNDRYRLFSLILYEDTTSYNIKEVLKNIKAYKFYAYIIHDKDLQESGEVKKKHFHVIIKLDNATTIKALAKKIGIPENFIQHARNERAMVRYLIHFDDDDKYQYQLSEIKSSRNYERYVKKCFDDLETEDVIIQNIFSYINENLNHLPYNDFMYYFLQYINFNCYETIYKRYRYEFKDYITLNRK